eukprot:CAMPEP_0172463366 /NCGR_PEP_ID=MMETSP1065-20121228/46927_1 /TAXON_ID=265537 /ORGANISM="Amphiprora paludosa, Strain CCMP125" /LENGTH=111 /DNA_ID=CAMNT_0013219291 /DNA_START=1 /DNA_END=336 /DNA_ORIENTATION=+
MTVTALVSPTPAVCWEAYKTVLTKHPLVTKSATAAVLSGISDAITQKVEPQKGDNEPRRTHNFVRSAHIMLTGFLWSGPIAHWWYQSLEQIIYILPAMIQQQPRHDPYWMP